MRKKRILIVISFQMVCGLILGWLALATELGKTMDREARPQWWREARFGLFITWGIYSQLGRGEWVMWNERIPVKEYEKLAGTFNPVKFDAEEWVKIAKEAGVRYIVITAKHHDGFSMFHTKVSPYNIVDATPFKRDPMAELAAVCRKHGLKLGFYYSHVREWHHPLAQSFEGGRNYGNFWDYPDESKKDLNHFVDEFAKPQLKELLTQYGPIGVIWFDTPSPLSDEKAKECADLVHSLQPACLVNSRVGGKPEYWDYLSMGDCEVPVKHPGLDWETPMTLSDSWGYYSSPDNQYKSLVEVIHILVSCASMGGNLLLNVGPTGEGNFPEQDIDLLRGIGQWMKVNSESIYGTEMSPFESVPAWGRVTVKGNRLYLHVFEWSNKIELAGLKTKVKSAHLLADPKRKIKVSQSWGEKARVTLEIPGAKPDECVSVIALELEGKPEVVPEK